MTQPDDEDAPGEDSRPFSRSPLSPSGVEYYVQAVPGFGSSGPARLATGDGISSRGLLGVVNRVLARRARTTEWERYYAFVYRDQPGGRVVAESEHTTMRAAREAALVFVERVEDGTLSGL